MKAFLITVDTEGDDLWSWKPGKEITTENTNYIPRFQELCEKYGFKPVYLTNYEMAMDDRWVAYSAEKARADGLTELILPPVKAHNTSEPKPFGNAHPATMAYKSYSNRIYPSDLLPLLGYNPKPPLYLANTVYH